MDDKINKLRRELSIRKYALNTVETYCSCLKVIFNKCGINPSIESLKSYLLTIENRNYHKQIVATFRNYSEFVLGIKLSLNDIPYPRKQESLPEIYSVEEISNLINIPLICTAIISCQTQSKKQHFKPHYKLTKADS